MLIKFVHFLFGKPCKKVIRSKLSFHVLFIGVQLYFIFWNAILWDFSFIDTVFIGSLISGGLFFPLIFRFIYFINLKMRGLEREV